MWFMISCTSITLGSCIYVNVLILLFSNFQVNYQVWMFSLQNENFVFPTDTYLYKDYMRRYLYGWLFLEVRFTLNLK